MIIRIKIKEDVYDLYEDYFCMIIVVIPAHRSVWPCRNARAGQRTVLA